MSCEIQETLPEANWGGTLAFSLNGQGCEFTINKLPQACALVRGGMRTARTVRG